MNEREFDYIGEELREGETVLWRGAPQLYGKGVRYKGSVYTTIVGLLFTAFAVFWSFMAMQMGGYFALMGIPFIAAGLYFIFGFNLTRKRKLARTQYAVTDKRIIIASAGQIKTMALSDIPNISKEYFDNGCGTISFDKASGFTGYYNRQAEMSPALRYVPFEFVNIENPGEVSRIIDTARGI